VNLEQASDESEVQTLLPQLNGMMQLLRIKGPPQGGGHTPTTRPASIVGTPEKRV
jgi:hypothetical protein